MQEFIKLLGEANRSTEAGWNEGLASKGSLLYRGTEIFFALHLVLMDGLIAGCALMPCLSVSVHLHSRWFVSSAPFARGHEEEVT
jgi:hypothetical protein